MLLLQTKFYQPRVTTAFIMRPHLLDRLNQGLNRKLTLITAPAGYGKTTIAAQWLAHRTENQPRAVPMAWLSLDEYDNDLLLFLRYLVAAIQTVYPDCGLNTLSIIQNPQPYPWHHLANILINDLTQLPTLILTLDDYHFIREEAIHQLLNRVLDHLPPSLKLVLLSRTEPPLALGRLRMRQQLNELRGADLSFSQAETAQFVTQMAGTVLQPETVQALHEKSEGWIGGLQLATLTLAQQADTEIPVWQAQGINHQTRDYLFVEVLSQQPPAVQTFLVQTAILKHFCAPLCETVLGTAWQTQVAEDDRLRQVIGTSRTPAQTLLEWLGQQHLFLIPLDEEGRWYRYHHLFQMMLQRNLQQQLSADDIAELHRRASLWLATEGMIEAAFQHALTAGDISLAVQVIERHRYHLLNQMEVQTLARWLSKLPPEVIEQQPALLLTNAWVTYFLHHQVSDIAPLIKQAECYLASEDPALTPSIRQVLDREIIILWTAVWFWQAEGQKILDKTLPALKTIPMTDTLFRSFAIMGIGNAYLLMNQSTQALRFLQTALEAEESPMPLLRARILNAIASIQFLLGDLISCHRTCLGILRLKGANVFPVDIGWAYYFSGFIYYEWNELARAVAHFSTGTELLFGNNLRVVQLNLLGLALSYQAQGQLTKAQEVVDKLHDIVLQAENNTMLNEVQTFQARLHLMQGQVETAVELLQTTTMKEISPKIDAIESPRLTKAKVLIAQGDEVSIQAAKDILQELIATAKQMNHIWLMIQLLPLEALIDQAQGQLAQALTKLEQAIILAKPGDFVRTFVDLGQPIARLLQQLLRRGVEPDYLRQILAAFPTTQTPLQITQTTQGQLAPPIQHRNSRHLIEPLTGRELEVLTLLADRFANKEIAQSLTISPATVRNHLSNIYQKLGVTSRKQAVDRAKNLELLF